MNYLLDTNIVLIFLRNNTFRTKIEDLYNIFSSENNPLLSVVSIGKIKSIANRNYWGNKRKKELNEILNSFIVCDINSEDVIEKYAEIDAFSQNKIIQKPLNNTPRNMGKNDLWIAATTSVTNATLITTDLDFLHLKDTFLNVEIIDIKKL